MSFRNRNKQFTRLMAIGMMLLALAGIANAALPRHAFFSASVSDGIIGLLYGLGIACTLLGFRRKAGCQPQS